MDKLLELNWFWKTYRSNAQLEQVYDCNFSDDETDVFLCHLYEIDHLHLSNSINNKSTASICDYVIDPRTKHEVKELIINVRDSNDRIFFDKFPIVSRLTKHEHQLLLDELFPENTQDRQQIDENLKNKLISKWNDEKKIFSEFLNNYFYQKLISRYRTIDKNIDNFILKYWKFTLHSILNDKQNNFQLQSAIPLDCLISVNCNLSIKDIGRIEEASADSDIPKIYMENLRLHIKNTIFKQQFHQLINQEIDNINSNDIELAIKYNVNVCLNERTFSQLIDYEFLSSNTDYWFFQFTINELSSAGGGGCNNKLICFESLPNVQLNIYNRNSIGYKYFLKNILYLHSSTSDSEDSEDHQIGDEKAYKIYEFNEYLSMNSKKPINDRPNHNEHRIVELTNLPTDQEESFKILVKTKYDGYIIDNQSQKKFVNVSVKVEYKSEFGAEQMTKSELIREWCNHILKPNSVTLRVRIDVTTGMVINYKFFNQIDIEKDLERLYNVRPVDILVKIYGIFTTIFKFPADTTYLLRNQDFKMANKTASVYKKCCNTDFVNSTAKGIINLSEYYTKKVNYELSTTDLFDWIPIDDRELINGHRQLNILPCTFPCGNSEGGDGGNDGNCGNIEKRQISRNVLVNDRKDAINRANKILERKRKRKKEWKASINKSKRKRRNTLKKNLKEHHNLYYEKLVRNGGKSSQMICSQFGSSTLKNNCLPDNRTFNTDMEMKRTSIMSMSSHLNHSLNDTPASVVTASTSTIKKSKPIYDPDEMNSILDFTKYDNLSNNFSKSIEKKLSTSSASPSSSILNINEIKRRTIPQNIESPSVTVPPSTSRILRKSSSTADQIGTSDVVGCNNKDKRTPPTQKSRLRSNIRLIGKHSQDLTRLQKAKSKIAKQKTA